MDKVVITEFMDGSAVDLLRPACDLHYDATLFERRGELVRAAADCRVLIVRNQTRVDRTLLDAAPCLDMVGRLGVGLDNIDLDECARRGIRVQPATGANALAVAEYVIAALLMLARGAYHAGADMLAGRWPRQSLMGGEVAGKTLGLLGLGTIAREVAARATALDMTVIAHDPALAADDPAWSTAGRRDFDTLLAESRYLSVHVPLTDGTRGLLGRDNLGKLPAGAALVNTARGGIVDEDALAALLRSGHLSGAAIDVFEREPLTAGDARRFEGLANVILTPHIAGVTGEANIRVSRFIAEAVVDHLAAAGSRRAQ